MKVIHFAFRKHRPWRFATVALAAIALIVMTTFQNCGKAGFETSGQENLALQQEEIQSDVTPFAFEAAIDQISYLSCANPSANGKTFTFKVGAYDILKASVPNTPDTIKSGVRVTKAYVDWAKQNLKPNYDPANPNNTLPTANDAKVYLATSKKNENPQLQFSMRQIKNLKNVYSKSSSASYEIDVIPLLGNLTDDRWLSPMMSGSFNATEPLFQNFFPLADDEKRYIEASLSLNQNEETAQMFRSEFDSNALLTLGFDDNLDNMLLRSPNPSSANVAYGLGFKLNFQQALDAYASAIYPNSQGPHPWNPRHILTDVTEVNLETSRPSGRTWSCPVSRRYGIVRKQDQAIHCPKDLVSRMTDPAYRRELEIVRRHFPAKDFDVSVDHRCLVPLNFSCYRDEPLQAEVGGTPYGMIPVEYDLTKPCFYNTQDTRQNYPLPTPTSGPPTPYCVEVASICLRN